jgi:hypothetical protein
MTNLMFKAYFWTFLLGGACGAYCNSKLNEHPHERRVPLKPTPRALSNPSPTTTLPARCVRRCIQGTPFIPYSGAGP